ncbi:MAG: hypothetical protein MMC23_004821 [Stictis urceolatum]|nr:hypothetical protein [Stictis urceolata]
MPGGVQPWTGGKPSYRTYKSPYAPQYKVPFNLAGFDTKQIGMTAASFGGVAGLFALFFFSDVPRVRKDIMQKLPIIGDHFVKDVPPEDNPF